MKKKTIVARGIIPTHCEERGAKVKRNYVVFAVAWLSNLSLDSIARSLLQSFMNLSRIVVERCEWHVISICAR